MDSTGYNSLCSLVCPTRSTSVPSQRVLGSKLKQRERVKSHLQDSWFDHANKQTSMIKDCSGIRSRMLEPDFFIRRWILLPSSSGQEYFQLFFAEYLSQLKTTSVKGKRNLICFQWSLLFTHLCDEHFTVFTYENSAKYKKNIQVKQPSSDHAGQKETQSSALQIWATKPLLLLLHLKHHKKRRQRKWLMHYYNQFEAGTFFFTRC